MRYKCGTGILPVTGKMPVPQVLLLKWKHYIIYFNTDFLWSEGI